MTSPSASPQKLPSFVLTALVTALLALHWWLGLSALVGKTVTNDETVHVVSGYSYWRFNDYRLQPENGNLPQRWGALPLLILKPHLKPAEYEELWRNSDVWRIGESFFFGSGNNTDYLLFCARATMGLWSVATGFLVFCWARKLWGDHGALLALTLYAISPTVLAHGSLVTSDMCAAFWLLAAVGAWWRASGEITLGNVIVSCLVTGMAFVAKFSCVLLLPMFFMMIGWRTLAPRPVRFGVNHHAAELTTAGRKAGILVALLALHLVVACVVIWACFGGRYTPSGPDLPTVVKYYVPWEDLTPAQGFWHYFFGIVRGWHLLPDAYLQGFAYVRHAAESRGAFLLGEFSNTGWWWFFPYAFFAKSSLAELATTAGLLIVAATALLRWERAGRQRNILITQLEAVFPLAAFVVVYGWVSVTGSLNIGQRHILPMYVVLFVGAGALIRPTLSAGWRAAAFSLPLLGGIESWSVRPHYLAFFNQAAGGPPSGWRQLVDSSLDWGQDLSALSDWVRKNRLPGEQVYVSYFGSGNPTYEGIVAQPLSPYFSYGRPRPWFELEPGLYCISATLLQDVYSNWRGPWNGTRENVFRRLLPQMRHELAAKQRAPSMAEFGQGSSGPLWRLDRMRFARLCTYLRIKQPAVVINYTEFVYRLSQEEVTVMVDGTMTQVSAMMERAATQRISSSSGKLP